MANAKKFDITDYLIPLGFGRVSASRGKHLMLPVYEFPDPGTPEAERLKRAATESQADHRNETTSGDFPPKIYMDDE